jgi:hypothetical protein
MAEVEEIPCSVKTQRNRKSNFSLAEEEMLQHEVGKHFEILNRKFSNTTTNHQKKAIWARITDKINALGVAIRTASEVRDKWRNTTSKAKSAFTYIERNCRKQEVDQHLKPPVHNWKVRLLSTRTVHRYSGIGSPLFL